MTDVKNLADAKQQIVLVGDEHAQDISRIYRSVMINPQLLLDCLSDSSQRKTAARQKIKGHGGFISPSSEAEMQQCMQHGLVMAAFLDGELVGFSRYVTAASSVQQAFFTEFSLDRNGEYSRAEHFTDWSGSKKSGKYKTLKSIHYIDREKAAIAVQAIQAACRNESSGKLAWAVDAAVLPQYQRLGLSKSIMIGFRKVIIPEFGFVAFRMFEIRKINNQDVCIGNEPSQNTFKSSLSTLFAFTDEEIVLRNDLTLRVRWYHLLKQY